MLNEIIEICFSRLSLTIRRTPKVPRKVPRKWIDSRPRKHIEEDEKPLEGNVITESAEMRDGEGNF